MSHAFRRRSLARHALPALASLASAILLAACGGGSGDHDAPGAGSSTSLSGSVAVGAPMSDARLRVLDASGAVVAQDIAVDADGRYAGVELTGPAPWRLEACGHAGPNYLCVYSVATAAGTANLTPLTTAAMLLAGGQTPATLMTGAAAGLTDSSVAAARKQLQDSLAGVMASAGVTAALDFVSAPLDAGSRTGYDKLLDAVGVNLGTDGNAFVQITPRLGSGNLYLEQGQSQGTLTASTSASGLSLAGLETLFRDMSAALASPAACAAEATGLRRSLASSAQLAMGDETASGRDAVAAAFCGFFAGGEEGDAPMWGSTLLSPTLGRCDLASGAPLCNVSFVLRDTAGNVQPVGQGMGVTQEAGVWKFAGDLLPISIHAGAKAQRTKRIDTPNPVYEYNRALAFEVAALPGLACARVAQKDATGTVRTIAFYKRHPGAMDQERLSLWTPDGFGPNASLDPMVGVTRSGDDTWLFLPEGSAGDAVIRNFYRGGRSVSVSLYSDASCATAFTIAGRSEFDVDVEGVPPIWSQLQSLPWPEIDAATETALRTLALDANGTGSLSAAWTMPGGPLGLDGATVCGSREHCGQGGTGRIGEADLRPSSRDVVVALRNTGPAIGAADSKMLALYGRNGEGVSLQSNYTACSSSPAGGLCR